jgi:hypothetical protein
MCSITHKENSRTKGEDFGKAIYIDLRI